MRSHTEEKNLPTKKLIPHTKARDGIVTTSYTEAPVDLTLERIEGIKAPIPEFEERVQATPTKAALKDHRQVDVGDWGIFHQPGPQVIYGDQPRTRDMPTVSGRPIPTQSETISETGLLRRTLERLLGAKEK